MSGRNFFLSFCSEFVSSVFMTRDDRCIADHARELWTPYLDEELVAFIQSLAIEEVPEEL